MTFTLVSSAKELYICTIIFSSVGEVSSCELLVKVTSQHCQNERLLPANLFQNDKGEVQHTLN